VRCHKWRISFVVPECGYLLFSFVDGVNSTYAVGGLSPNIYGGPYFAYQFEARRRENSGHLWLECIFICNNGKERERLLLTAQKSWQCQRKLKQIFNPDVDTNGVGERYGSHSMIVIPIPSSVSWIVVSTSIGKCGNAKVDM